MVESDDPVGKQYVPLPLHTELQRPRVKEALFPNLEWKSKFLMIFLKKTKKMVLNMICQLCCKTSQRHNAFLLGC